MNDSTSGTSALSQAYVPPKNWEDISSDEKIERMREIIKNLTGSVSRAQADIHKIKMSFKTHSHEGTTVVVPYSEYDNGGLAGIAASLSNGNYF